MKKRWQPGCPCCGCEYFADVFDRATSTSVGGSYTEVAGDWSIFDFGGGAGSLLIQEADAILTIDAAHPGGEANGVLIVAMFGYHAGDEGRVLIDYVDEENYKFFRLTFGASGSCALGQVIAGATTTLVEVDASVPEAAFYYVYLYWGNRCGTEIPYMLALVNPAASSTFNPVAEIHYDYDVSFSTDGKALATGSLTSAILFDQVSLAQHNSEAKPGCACYALPCRTIQQFGFDGGALFELSASIDFDAAVEADVNGVCGAPLAIDMALQHWQNSYVAPPYYQPSYMYWRGLAQCPNATPSNPSGGYLIYVIVRCMSCSGSDAAWYADCAAGRWYIEVGITEWGTSFPNSWTLWSNSPHNTSDDDFLDPLPAIDLENISLTLQGNRLIGKVRAGLYRHLSGPGQGATPGTYIGDVEVTFHEPL